MFTHRYPRLIAQDLWLHIGGDVSPCRVFVDKEAAGDGQCASIRQGKSGRVPTTTVHCWLGLPLVFVRVVDTCLVDTLSISQMPTHNKKTAI